MSLMFPKTRVEGRDNELEKVNIFLLSLILVLRSSSMLNIVSNDWIRAARNQNLPRNPCRQFRFILLDTKGHIRVTLIQSLI